MTGRKVVGGRGGRVRETEKEIKKRERERERGKDLREGKIREKREERSIKAKRVPGIRERGDMSRRVEK